MVATRWFKRLTVLVVMAGLPMGLSGLFAPAVAHGDDVVDIARAIFKAIRSPGKESADAAFPATHEQTGIIKVLPKKDKQGRQLACFCLHTDGNLLAAITADPGELRVLSPAGDLVDTWELPIRPEAINLDKDGTILVAGQGQLLRLSSSGDVVHQQESPHMAAFQDTTDQLREQVVEQMRSTADSLRQQLDAIAAQVRQLKNISAEQEQELKLLQAAIDKIADQREGDLTDRQREAVQLRRELVKVINESIEAGITKQNRATIEILEKQMASYEDYLQRRGNSRPTPEEIDQMVEQLRQSRSQISSISSSGTDVFVATNAAKGYGYDVWRMTPSFEDAEKIVTGLRGCCGQMDVQANEHGVFVAENSRHRVSRYDREGQAVKHWGKRSRSGVRGFGGCCNPMNVAFGTDGSVYAAESNSGRIKRYSVDGELLALIGSVKLVPGCKKVSIAVSDDGNQVYMLDITRNHIVVMEARTPKDNTAQHADQRDDQRDVAAAAN